MRINPGIKPHPKSADNRQAPFSLHATLDQYEVEELDPREIAHLLSKDRRRTRSTNPTADD